MATLLAVLQRAYHANVDMAVRGGELHLRATTARDPDLIADIRAHKPRLLHLVACGGGTAGAYGLAALHDAYHRLNCVRVWREPHEDLRERFPSLWERQEAVEHAWFGAVGRMRGGQMEAESEMLAACRAFFEAWRAIGDRLDASLLNSHPAPSDVETDETYQAFSGGSD